MKPVVLRRFNCVKTVIIGRSCLAFTFNLTIFLHYSLRSVSVGFS